MDHLILLQRSSLSFCLRQLVDIRTVISGAQLMKGEGGRGKGRVVWPPNAAKWAVNEYFKRKKNPFLGSTNSKLRQI
jgi:hypothetical protein